MGRGRRGGNPASVKENNFWNTLNKNAFLDNEYFRRLVELSCAMFEWKNLPEGMDERYIEMGLFRDGRMLFFKDEDLPEGQQYLCTRCTAQGPYDMYNIPIYRTAFANNGYNRTLSKEDSVIIFNNYLHTNSWIDICGKAERLSNIDQTIDVNVNAQKTPVLILCDENEKLTMLFSAYVLTRRIFRKTCTNSKHSIGMKHLHISESATYLSKRKNVWYLMK